MLSPEERKAVALLSHVTGKCQVMLVKDRSVKVGMLHIGHS